MVVVSVRTMFNNVNSRPNGLHGSFMLCLVMGVLTSDASAIDRSRLPSSVLVNLLCCLVMIIIFICLDWFHL